MNSVERQADFYFQSKLVEVGICLALECILHLQLLPSRDCANLCQMNFPRFPSLEREFSKGGKQPFQSWNIGSAQ